MERPMENVNIGTAANKGDMGMALVTIRGMGLKYDITTYVKKGETLSKVLADEGLHIDMQCGGRGTCNKCIVSICGEDGPSCQYRINDDIMVEIPQVKPYEQIMAGDARGVVPGKRLYGKWGVSVDIGTTSICVMLRGDSTYVAKRVNPQTTMGADVLSRIHKAISGELDLLREGVRTAVRDMIRELAAQGRIAVTDIDAVVVTGNTTMLYLFTGRNPRSLGFVPFNAEHLFGELVPFDTVGLGFLGEGRAYLGRCVSAFIGADAVMSILASGICDSSASAMLVDIGTNGEIVLYHEGAIYCASTAAGPAFEGSELSCGTYAVTGAIERVWESEGRACYSTIGLAPAIGICASGVVDCAAVMLRLGVMDATGYMDDPFELDENVNITIKDVRKLQLAKAAIRAGMETLVEVAGIGKSQIGTFYVAGAFGNYLDIRNAAYIGLVPHEFTSVFKHIGNAAHTGATMILEDESLIGKGDMLAGRARVVPLETSQIFMDNFYKYMSFL